MLKFWQSESPLSKQSFYVNSVESQEGNLTWIRPVIKLLNYPTIFQITKVTWELLELQQPSSTLPNLERHPTNHGTLCSSAEYMCCDILTQYSNCIWRSQKTYWFRSFEAWCKKTHVLWLVLQAVNSPLLQSFQIWLVLYLDGKLWEIPAYSLQWKGK